MPRRETQLVLRKRTGLCSNGTNITERCRTSLRGMSIQARGATISTPNNGFWELNIPLRRLEGNVTQDCAPNGMLGLMCPPRDESYKYSHWF